MWETRRPPGMLASSWSKRGDDRGGDGQTTATATMVIVVVRCYGTGDGVCRIVVADVGDAEQKYSWFWVCPAPTR